MTDAELRADLLAWIAARPEGQHWRAAVDRYQALGIDGSTLLRGWEDLLGTGAIVYPNSAGTRAVARGNR